MFRELTRIKQKLPPNACEEILTQEKRGVLSVLGENGYPYGMPMNHWFDSEDGCIYFHCGNEGHRTDALKQCAKVSYCVCEQGTKQPGEWAYNVRSIIVFGQIDTVTDSEKMMQIAYALSRKFTDDERYIANEIQTFMNNTLFLRLIPAHISGKLVNEA